MVALDAKTGAVTWDHPLKQGADDSYLRGGPLLVRGKVIEGTACHSTAGGCRIFALDAGTGEEVWRFYTIARPGEPGGDSWNGAPLAERYGGSVWTSGSYDPELNLLYFGIGQTYATATLLKPHAATGKSADGLYTDATVALDPDTGRLVWYYQHFNRDVWDFDWVFERTLAELPIDGRMRKVSVTGGKLGIFDVLDRATGRYLFSQDLGLQNLVVSIDPRSGRKIVDPRLAPKFDVTETICPHGGGARNWPATAFNPTTHILYVPMIESCTDFIRRTRTPAEVAAGAVDIGFVLKARPDSDGNFGRFEAIDLAAHKVLWTQRRRAPELAAALVTAGEVVFDGSRDRVFRASDAETGRTLWETRLPAVPSSSPITYGIDGEQYVAVVAGGGGSHDTTWSSLTPEIDNPTGSTTLLVFKLAPTGSSPGAGLK
jgi:alcohol dehydrogenase (cytochrome c)